MNDVYIGNLGGHFEAWFFTWEEVLALAKYEPLFLLLLPMTEVETEQIPEAQNGIAAQLKTLPHFEAHAGYIAECILNGLKMDGHFYNQETVGTGNRENHSVRNIEKDTDNTEAVKMINNILRKVLFSI